jgi:hypothetical protein
VSEDLVDLEQQQIRPINLTIVNFDRFEDSIASSCYQKARFSKAEATPTIIEF